MSDLKIRRLKLRNYRCFPEIEVDFHEQLTVLVAQNGAGKTSILDALAVALGPYVGAFDESKGRHFEHDDIRMSRVRDTAGNEMEYARGGVALIVDGYIPGSLGDALGYDALNETTWRRSLAGPTKAKTTIKDAKELSAYGKRMQDAVRTPGAVAILPVLAYYGTGRLWQLKKLMSRKLPRTSRTIGYTDCLDPGSSYKAFAEWFRNWSTSALKGRLDAAQSGKAYVRSEFDGYIESVSTAVNCCLALTGWGNIEFNFGREELVVHHKEHGELPTALLSDGIRNMIGMVADIAFRATKLNPDLGASAARETPGIVLIDEVDMHLHPEWQQVVLASLTEAFPRIQFIVTTHSPQVLTTVRRECIRCIEWEKGIPVVRTPAHETYAQESRTALEDVLHVSSRPPVEVALKLREYLRRVEDGEENVAEVKQLRVELETSLGAGDAQLQLADMLIARNEAMRLKARA